jgi:serine/threonine protein kinase
MSPRAFPDFSGRTIDAGRLFLRKILGRGGTGVVYEATDIVDPARPTYAVKWLGLPKNSGMRREQQLEYLDRFDAEYLHHARVSDHPNVVTLHRVIDDAELRCKWLVLDYCPGGDLFDAITTRNPFWLNEERTRSICLQLIDAVAHCHARGIYRAYDSYVETQALADHALQTATSSPKTSLSPPTVTASISATSASRLRTPGAPKPSARADTTHLVSLVC